MNKNEMIQMVNARIKEEHGEELEMTKDKVQAVLETYADVVRDTLADKRDERIPLPGVGAFKAKHVNERAGKSALNGKAWSKPAHDELVFTVSKDAKEF